MHRPLATCLLAVALGACGGADPAPQPDASPDADVESVADAEVAADAEAPRDVLREASAPYPAFRPEAPAVASAGGPVLRAPRLVPVFVRVGDPVDGPEERLVMQFLTRYASSATWRAQLEEYGVGEGSVAPAVHTDGAGLATGTISSTRLRAWVMSQVESRAWGDHDENTLYVIMLGAGRQVQVLSTVTCQGVGGYHADFRDGARTPVAYAVIPDCGEGLDTITRVLSHEIVEAATDPYPNTAPAYYQPSTAAPPEGAWAVAYTGGEIGDMCEHRADARARPDDLEYEIQRSWSNRAAAAMADPCVPAIDGRAYFNAAPSLPDTVTILDLDRVRVVSARGVTLPEGGSRTIDVRLFSTAPTRGPWRVAARETPVPGAAPALRFSWDRASGVNGDVLHLTISARDDATDGRVFEVISSLDGVTTSWVGAVVTE